MKFVLSSVQQSIAKEAAIQGVAMSYSEAEELAKELGLDVTLQGIREAVARLKAKESAA
jgi:hypothetical protein